MTLETSKPEFLLDECAHMMPSDLVSGKYIRSTSILRQGTPDHILFEEAEKRNLTIITADRGLVVRAITHGRPVIYQDRNCDRYEIHSKLFMRNYVRRGVSIVTKHILLNDKVVLP
ncbi:MAG: hypothetical protein KGI27_13025 [Thaumarchaeota archaeon]|nr:hypothetical protein [Nitrososphaerota archaeon]